MEQAGHRQQIQQPMACEKNSIRQMRRFGWSMITLALSMGLYYLGFFNSTEGPLNSHRVGAAMADMGITVSHLVLVLALLFVVSLSWNWVYNLYQGRRLAAGAGCRTVYTPLRKGVWGHTVWAALLILMAGVVYCAYF